MEFKVWDTVRIKNYCSWCKKWDICVLSQWSKYWDCVDELFAYNGFTEWWWCCCQDNRELIKEPVYKVWDRVKIKFLKSVYFNGPKGPWDTVEWNIVSISPTSIALDNIKWESHKELSQYTGLWKRAEIVWLVEEEIKPQLYTTPLYVDEAADYDSGWILREIADMSLKETLNKAYESKPIVYTQRQYNALLNSKSKTPMNTLRQNLRDRFFKKEESKIADLVESVEERLVPIQELDKYLRTLFTNVWYKIWEMERAVEDKDKESIKQFKTQLEDYYKELNDALMKQLLMVADKLVLKSKKD